MVIGHFWAEGYYVSTVGLDKNKIKKYIQNKVTKWWPLIIYLIGINRKPCFKDVDFYYTVFFMMSPL